MTDHVEPAPPSRPALEVALLDAARRSPEAAERLLGLNVTPEGAEQHGHQ